MGYVIPRGFGGSHSGLAEDSSLLGCDVVSLGKYGWSSESLHHLVKVLHFLEVHCLEGAGPTILRRRKLLVLTYRQCSIPEI
jgi:hypothetical protein